ncbi:MAG: DNA-directed RNA polymerase core subunit rpc40 [Thelocarpon impressellum]|nr:MAG: DNA-directed RNA polymerase core subunit rpc40 [Thelocarpon impressellum]
MVAIASQEEVERRRIVGVNKETVTDVTSTDFPGHHPGEDHSWSLAKFKEGFHVKFHDVPDPLNCSFSLIGVDASIANAFRRILLAEIPTLAIEFVFVHNNTSIIQDEVLAHRLGLVPLKGGKEGLHWLKWFQKPTEEDPDGSPPRDNNTVVMKLAVECTRNEEAEKGETDPAKLYHNSNVYASALTYVPSGRQPEHFPTPADHIAPVNPDILLAKLRPGQEINLEAHCIKGIGADHAKFSPVATASYRLLPAIKLKQPILGSDAEKFARCFPKGVIGLAPLTLSESALPEHAGHPPGTPRAVVRDPFRDTVSRECLRHEEFAGKVELGRVRDHFIFQIESTGQFDADDLFVEAVKVLRVKCERLRRGLGTMVR